MRVVEIDEAPGARLTAVISLVLVTFKGEECETFRSTLK
jgi:hypothetical protein